MRKYYIDNLRWIIILLLIPYHAAMAWNVWGEPNYIFFEGNAIISSIVVFLSPYFMPVMFLIAGVATRSALQKRTAGQYILERAKKLLIPFVFGTISLMPLMTYIADKFHYNYDGDLFRHYYIFFTRFTDLTGADGGFSVGQFWFLFYLFLISLTAVGMIVLQKKMLPGYKKTIPMGLICLMGLPLPFLSGLLSLGEKSIVEYTYIFLAGYYVFSRDDVVDKIERYKWIFLCIGLTASVFNVYMFIWSDIQYALPGMIAKFLSEWFMMLALIGSGKRYLDFSNRSAAYMSKRSFAFYVFHYIWVVLFQFVLYSYYGDDTILLYLVPVCLAYLVTFLCCEVCARLSFLT